MPVARIHDLIKQLRASNPELSDEIAREVEVLSQRRAFGLNFERHTPETVELPGRRVRVGDKVRILPPRGETPKAEHGRLWRVLALEGPSDARTAELEAVVGRDELESTSAAVADLVVVAEFRDPIYPGLVSTGKVERGGDKPFHTVINAENYHALQALLYTHRGAVDAIYIDPPYNTGNDSWIYNDKYVTNDDMYRHSKWLAFMERRLRMAKSLLSPNGVIIVAIGDEEHHRLRMLLDQIFGAQNFLANLTWQGNLKSDARFSGGGTDYMLVYAASVDELTRNGVRWLERKPGVDEILAAGRSSWEKSTHDPIVATQIFKAWWKTVPKESPWRANQEYKNIDKNGDVYLAGPIDSPSYRPNLIYEVKHPTTGRPVPIPKNGWRVARETMMQLIADDEVVFKADDSVLPSRKFLLKRVTSRVPDPTFRLDRRSASTRLARILGDRRFPFPKDHELLMRWLEIVSPSDGTILDFFGGSATTTEAVMRLNDRDNGTRQCILVTNNEVAESEAKKLRKQGSRVDDITWQARGVYEYVARPRIRAVVNGTLEDGSHYSTGFDENVEFFTLTYESAMRVQSNREFGRIAPLLWLRAGSRGRRIESLPDGWDVAETYGVIEDIDKTEPFIEAMVATPGARLAFVVTDEDRVFEAIAKALPDSVEPVRLYDSYLRNFEIDAMRGER